MLYYLITLRFLSPTPYQNVIIAFILRARITHNLIIITTILIITLLCPPPLFLLLAATSLSSLTSSSCLLPQLPSVLFSFCSSDPLLLLVFQQSVSSLARRGRRADSSSDWQTDVRGDDGQTDGQRGEAEEMMKSVREEGRRWESAYANSDVW